MIKIISMTLLLSATLLAQEYVYGFTQNGHPASRVHAKTGKVQIYTDVHTKKLTPQMLMDIYEKYYSNVMDYDDFEYKMKIKYPQSEYRFKDVFRWFEYNSYLRAKDIREFHMGMKL